MPVTTGSSSKGPEVFVLGAGFSRAVSGCMPLTDELGNEALLRDRENLGRPDSKSIFRDGQFEAWLSRRAEAQPYLASSAAIANQAVFARATALIGRILDERVQQVLESPLPAWLGELLTIWHLRKSHVLTFNYDPIVECAFETMRFWDWKESAPFQWGSLLNYSPEGKAGASFAEEMGSGAPHPSFRLWKLHGSLNWLWVPGDSSGATVRRVRLPGTFGAPVAVTDEELHWRAPGRERFIVPPAALKSSYYSNPVTREIWQRGYNALRSAERISLLGYSLPQTDLSTSGMLAEALAGGAVGEVNIVDLAHGGGSIPARVRALGIFGVEPVTDWCGDDAVIRYVDRLVADASSEAFVKIRGALVASETPLLVDWGDPGDPHKPGRSAAIVKADLDWTRGAVVLASEELSTISDTTRSRRNDAPGNAPVTVAELRAMSGGPAQVILNVPGVRRDIRIVDAVTRTYATGHGDGTWLQLVPAGHCSD